MSFFYRKFRSPEEHCAKFRRVIQVDRVDHAFEREIIVSDEHRQTHARKKTVQLRVARAQTISQIALQRLGHHARAEQLIDAIVRDEVAALRVLIRHQLVLRRVDQEKDHADIFSQHLLFQFFEFDGGDGRSAQVLFLDRDDVFRNGRPDHFADAPVARVVKDEDVLDAAVEQSFYAFERFEYFRVRQWKRGGLLEYELRFVCPLDEAHQASVKRDGWDGRVR